MGVFLAQMALALLPAVESGQWRVKVSKGGRLNVTSPWFSTCLGWLLHQRSVRTQDWAVQLVSLTIKVHNAPPSSAGWVCEATVVARHDNCGGIHKVLGWVIGQLSKGGAQKGEGEQLHIDALKSAGVRS